MINIQLANWFNASDRNALQAIRREVFVYEQGVSEAEEMDAFDIDSTHLLATYETHDTIGCARILPSGQIGRMAVRTERRGQGVGSKLLDAAIAEAKHQKFSRIFLHAQCHAESFYAQFGFHRIGDVFCEAGIEHIAMLLRK